MWMERRGLLLGAASMSAALGLGAPNAQVKEAPAPYDLGFSDLRSALCRQDRAGSARKARGCQCSYGGACDACHHAGEQAACSSGPRLGGRGRRPSRPLLPRGAHRGLATVLLPQQHPSVLPHTQHDGHVRWGKEFLGVWNVESVLSSVKLPLGPDFVPDARVRMPLLSLMWLPHA